MKEGILKTSRFIEESGQSLRAFAREHNLDVSELSKVLRGKRTRMSIEMAARLEIATKGMVKVPMWINDDALRKEYVSSMKKP